MAVSRSDAGTSSKERAPPAARRLVDPSPDELLPVGVAGRSPGSRAVPRAGAENFAGDVEPAAGLVRPAFALQANQRVEHRRRATASNAGLIIQARGRALQ
jgi:hypothetical protein